jgi:hypothetical protein
LVAAGRGQGITGAQIAREFWPKDQATAELVIRAATAPAMTNVAGWAQELAAQAVGSFLGSLLDSAAAQVLARAPLFNEPGYATVHLPRATTNPAPGWIGEGQPIPVAEGVLNASTLGPPKKLGIIESFTLWLAQASTPSAELVVETMLRDAAAKQLDASLFSASAATATAPAGLLNGISASTASTGTVGVDAAIADAQVLVDAVVAGGGGASGICFVASPGRALALRTYIPTATVFASASVPSAELICLDTRALASMFGATPEITAAQETVLHYESATPADIGTVGTPNVVAVPSKSLFQTAALALRLILRAAWLMRTPAIAHIDTGMVW